MAEAHLDHPGNIRWFNGYGPSKVLGPCPHGDCPHNMTSVIAHGPDFRRYTLEKCDVPEHCNGGCRAWLDDPHGDTTPWLQVETVGGREMRAVHGRAVDAVTAVSRPSKHSQLCPVWTQPARNVAASECSCWVRRNAAAYIAALEPAGLVVVPAEDVDTVLDQRVGHSHLVPGMWDESNRPEIAGKPCVECAARSRLRAALPATEETREDEQR